MPVRRAECAWAPCELLTPRQYVYVKIANRCMVPWCTQGASAGKALPRKGALKKSVWGPFSSLRGGESPRFDPWLFALRNNAYLASPDSVLPSLRALFAPPGVKRCIT